MNCLRGSKRKLTGSVVRLKVLPRPLVCLSLGPKVTWVFHLHDSVTEGREGKHPQTEWDTHLCILTGNSSCSYPDSGRNAGSLACWATFRSGGGMWVGMETEAEGVVKREGV